MTQEEKARAYDEVLNKLRHFIAKGVDPLITRADVQDFFPELAESEDERMWKLIKKYAHCNISDMALNADHITREQLESWLEKQGKQKHAIEMKTPEESLGIDSDTYSKIVDECVYGEQKPVEDRYMEGYLNGVNDMSKTLKPVDWSENDEQMLAEIVKDLQVCKSKDISRATKDAYQNEIDWLKSLKGRVQPKQEWSEEDVRKMRAIVTIINSTPQSIICSIDQDRESLCNWLKSLRPHSQWKPSDEQMEYLAKAITTLGDEGNCKTASILNDLRVDLKKLMEE